MKDKNIHDIMLECPGAREGNPSYKLFNDDNDDEIFNDVDDQIDTGRKHELPIEIEGQSLHAPSEEVEMYLDNEGHVQFRGGDDISTELDEVGEVLDGINGIDTTVSRNEYFRNQPLTSLMQENIILDERLRSGTSYEVNIARQAALVIVS